MRLNEIQKQVGRGEYRVDAEAVAAAIVRRLMQQHKHPPPEHDRAQGECS